MYCNSARSMQYKEIKRLAHPLLKENTTTMHLSLDNSTNIQTVKGPRNTLDIQPPRDKWVDGWMDR